MTWTVQCATDATRRTRAAGPGQALWTARRVRRCCWLTAGALLVLLPSPVRDGARAAGIAVVAGALALVGVVFVLRRRPRSALASASVSSSVRGTGRGWVPMSEPAADGVRPPEWLALSERAFACIVTKLAAGNDRLYHAYRAGLAKAPATASDYANMTWAALRLFAATGSDAYLDQAVRWTEVLDRHYWDGTTGGYFTAADDTGDVVVRLKSAADDAVPNANAIQLSNLVRPGRADGRKPLRRPGPRSHQGVFRSGGAVPHRSLRFPRRGTRSRSLGSNSRECCWPPRTAIPIDAALDARCSGVYRQGATPVSPRSLLSGKPALGDKSTAYVCVGPVCSAPLDEPEMFRQRLQQARLRDAATE